MVALTFGATSFDRDRGNFPDYPVVNMIFEEIPNDENGALQSRPGLRDSGISFGTGAIKAIYQCDGVFDNRVFVVGDTFTDTTGFDQIIDGDDHPTIVGFENHVFANAGGRIWYYNGTVTTTIPTPDNVEVQNICVGASRLILISKDTGRFYWSDPLDTTIDALSFATAENSPDKLKACLFLGDNLILFGSETVEFWPSSGDPDLPFQPLVGGAFQVGIRNSGCAALFSSSFAWITNDNRVCLGRPEGIISSPSLEEKITNSTEASLWTFTLEGVEFLAVRLDTETWVISSRTRMWSQFESYGEDNWLPRCFAGGYFGSNKDGKLLQWSSNYLDLDGPLERRFRAGTPIASGRLPLNSVVLQANPGQTGYIAGDYSTPTVSLRVSKDDGHTWSPYYEKSLGPRGNFRQRLQWRGLGSFSYPGLLAEFRVTDPVPFRASGVFINEPYGAV